jgi:hypothetical protein
MKGDLRTVGKNLTMCDTEFLTVNNVKFTDRVVLDGRSDNTDASKKIKHYGQRYNLLFIVNDKLFDWSQTHGVRNSFTTAMFTIP